MQYSQARSLRPEQRRYRFLLTICGLYLVLAATGVQADEPAGSRRPPAIAKSAITAQVEKFQKDADLDADSKKEAISILDSAAAEWAAGNEATERASAFTRQLESAVEELEALRARLAALPETAAPAILQESDLSKLTRRHDELEAKLEQEETGLQAQLSHLAEEIEGRPDRLEKVVDELAKFSSRLEKVQEELKSLAGEEQSSPVVIAQHILLQVQEQRCEQEISAAKAERDWLESSDADHWLQSRQHLLEREVADIEAEMKLVNAQLDEGRRRQAAERVAEARQESQSVHPALQPLARENEALAEESRKLTERLEETGADHELAEELLDALKAETDSIEKMIETVGMTDAIGLMLRQQHSQLPDAWKMRRNMAARAEEMRDLRLRQFELQRLEKQAPDAAAVVTAVRQQASAAADFHEATLRQQAEGLIEHRDELLEQLQDDSKKLFEALVGLDETKQRTLNQVRAFNTLHDEHVLWIRSAKIFSWNDFRYWNQWDANVVGAAAWKNIADALYLDLGRRPLLYWIAAAVILAYALLRLRTRRQLTLQAEAAASPECQSITPTLLAMMLTLLKSGVWPALLAFVAWRLDESTTQATWGRSLAGGLWRVAYFTFPLLVIRATSGRYGLGPAHFGWSADFARRVKRQVSWFLPVGSGLLFVVGAVESFGNESLSDSLGRLAFFVLMAAGGLFCNAVLRNGSADEQSALGGSRGGQFIRWTGRLMPWALLFLAAAGYYYTALQLAWRLQETFWAVVAIMGLRAVFTRWIQLAERRIVLSPNLTAGTAVAPKRKSLFAWNRWSLAERGIDLATMTRQMQGLLHTAILVGFTVSAWGIWSDVLPLGMLNRVELWHTTVTHQVIEKNANGATIPRSETQLDAVTAADLGLAGLILLVALVAVRNIPGLVQVVLLERLPLDVGARFAVTIIVRYVLLVVGIIISCAQINLGWANVQWLVAAASVGLGFGLQEIFANFVSGIILLLERPIRVGDVITIGETTGSVSQIRVRSTTILDGDHKELVVPNKDFITGKLLNWTLSDRTNRIVIKIGVSYSCDPERVRRLLQEIAQSYPAVLKDPAPTVTLEEFAPNALMFVVRAFLPTLDDRRKAIHELHSTIHSRFLAEGIEIPAPSAVKKAPAVGTAA